MVDGLEILSDTEKFDWYRVIIHHPLGKEEFLNLIVGAINEESIKIHYSLEKGYQVLNIFKIKKDGTPYDKKKWRDWELKLLLKELCGPYFYPDAKDLESIDALIEQRIEKEKRLITALIGNYSDDHAPRGRPSAEP